MRLVLFIALGVVLVAAIAVLLVFFLGGGDKDDPNLGVYEAVSCMVDGVEVGTEDEWIELKARGKATLRILDEEFSAKWTLDGRNFTLEQGGDTYEGKLKRGVLTIDLYGMTYTFAREGAEVELPEPSKEPEKAAEVGCWTLLRLDGANPEDSIDEEAIALLKSLGMEYYVILDEDGTGVCMFDYPVKITWGNGNFAPIDEPEDPVNYAVVDGLLHVYEDGDDYVFTPREGEVPEIDWSQYTGGDTESTGEPVDVPVVTEPEEPEPAAGTGSYDWWEGDWYGWWVAWDTGGALTDWEDCCWDCCATISVFDDDTGYISFWDEDTSAYEDLGYAYVSFVPAETERGWMVSESGNFMGCDLGYADWLVTPESSIVSSFDQMICIQGYYANPENADDWMVYYIFLRPWGMEWEDVRTGDTTGMPYSDMMPLGYDSWYLPLIRNGESMPYSFD